ncbi:NADP-dependent oxidoreductase [Allokutzneria sp. A3M-2-11 16]|uniref:NADP-dependent oxidoreductase n=1 Tax=Allokutzneria sp. A3M-2-11 16 TaxID=2962043 RepID=UPI0020B6DD93|nr:NADP-dependent oxidoreductase [Allokutzneria sp. A3M-2-11 16]MCP3804154.1 NADP-dependent oxidoreductase [Allokutzneria sp. A3M-2-11 16]
MTLPTDGVEIRLASRPEGWPTSENFTITRAAVPAVGAGQVLVRNLVMSVDPYMRGRMSDAKSYIPPFEIGKALEGGAVGEVIASESPDLAVGDVVLHDLGWREFAVVDAGSAVKVDPSLAEGAYGVFLGVLGMPGLTAYAGLLKAAEFREGDVVFVSGAAGAVGALVGQIARLRGAAKVIGSAGSAEKVAHLKDDLGFDEAFNYKDGPVLEQLEKAAPEGIDVYFDNVAGEHLEAALSVANQGARFALCGAISQYNEKNEVVAPRNLFNAITKGMNLRGFIVAEYSDVKEQFFAEVGGWLAEGKLIARETVVEGLENAPTAFIDLMRGTNTGKMLVKI